MSDAALAAAAAPSGHPGALATTPRPPVTLYVHVPFCLSVCPYCDFVVYGGRAAARSERGLIEPLVAALAVEIGIRGAAARAALGPTLPPLRSLYIGGGTPSLLTAAEVARLITAADRAFGVLPDAEITLEVNPGSHDRGDLAGFRAAGVNRLSIGAQAMDAGDLRTLGRRHDPEDVATTMRLAHAARFDNVSLDLLYDVPRQSLAGWERTLRAALSLEPDHVSAYALTLTGPPVDGDLGAQADLLSPRPGALRWRRRALEAQDEDRAADMYLLADSRLAGAGFEWYELSNWARPGRESRHNLCYWRADAYEAVGPGAHAFDGALTRRWNAARIDRYISALVPADGTAARLPPGGQETLDVATAAAERAMLRLRMSEGLDPGAAAAEVGPALAWAAIHGLTRTTTAGSFVLTHRGRLLANELFARLLPGAVQKAA